MDDQLSKSGVSDDIKNGRHRLIRDVINNAIDGIMHQGLGDEDRAYIVEYLATAALGLSIPSFRETIEKKDDQIVDLKVEVGILKKELEEAKEAAKRLASQKIFADISSLEEEALSDEA